MDADTLRWALQQANVAKFNEAELARVGHLLALDDAAAEARAGVLVSGGLERVVVTRGAAGAWTLDAAGRIESVAVARRVCRRFHSRHAARLAVGRPAGAWQNLCGW